MSRKTESIEESPQLKQPRFEQVVLVDDNELELFINRAIVKELGLSKNIRHVPTARMLLKELKSARRQADVPDLIFLDLVMPDVDGFAFIHEFNELPLMVREKCRIVVVTSSMDNNHKYRALMNPNVIRYINKPLDVYHLKDFLYM